MEPIMLQGVIVRKEIGKHVRSIQTLKHKQERYLEPMKN